MDTLQKIWSVLATVNDPELPVLSIIDLGIVREVQVNDGLEPTVVITPTYTGCPAMDVISLQIRATMAAAGLGAVQVRQVLSPAWTTDWISAEGRQKLQAYGIAPPPYLQSGKTSVCCPNCGSDQTELLSYFGSTACKSLYRCKDCLEPFDQFKCH